MGGKASMLLGLQRHASVTTIPRYCLNSHQARRAPVTLYTIPLMPAIDQLPLYQTRLVSLLPYLPLTP